MESWQSMQQDQRRLLARGRASGEFMQVILGHITWCCLLRREALSVLHAVYAFERAHSTVFEPHRPPSSSWQALRRMAFWKTMLKNFTLWVHECAVSDEEHLRIPEGRRQAAMGRCHY